jgi:hypothetical protein
MRCEMYFAHFVEVADGLFHWWNLRSWWLWVLVGVSTIFQYYCYLLRSAEFYGNIADCLYTKISTVLRSADHAFFSSLLAWHNLIRPPNFPPLPLAVLRRCALLGSSFPFRRNLHKFTEKENSGWLLLACLLPPSHLPPGKANILYLFILCEKIVVRASSNRLVKRLFISKFS